MANLTPNMYFVSRLPKRGKVWWRNLRPRHSVPATANLPNLKLSRKKVQIADDNFGAVPRARARLEIQTPDVNSSSGENKLMTTKCWVQVRDPTWELRKDFINSTEFYVCIITWLPPPPWWGVSSILMWHQTGGQAPFPCNISCFGPIFLPFRRSPFGALDQP